MPCTLTDARRLTTLYRKHVAYNGPVSIARLQTAVQRETRAAESGKIKVSRGLLRELRADRAEIGKIVKRCR